MAQQGFIVEDDETEVRGLNELAPDSPPSFP
jgi:hypothetical protein